MSELSIVVKATVVLIFGIVAARLFRHAAASTRHLILTATFAALLLLPAAITAMPGIAIVVPFPSAVSAPSLESAAARLLTGATSSVADDSAPAVAGAPRLSSVSSLISWPLVARFLWVAGAVLLLLRLGIALWRFERLRRNGLPWPHSHALVASLTTGIGIHRSVHLLLHEELAAPATCGWLRPAILLPSDAPAWSDSDVRRAIVHELEHVKRGDWAIHLLAHAACAAFWFNPLVWMAFRQLCLEAERACDDAVLQSAERTDYAAQLVQLARRLSNAPPQPALAMASRSDLSARISAILDATQSRGRLGALPAIAIAIVAAVLVAAVAPLRAVAVQSASRLTAAPQSASQAAQPQRRIVVALDRALLEAADDGDLDGISELIAAGANVNAAITGDGSPLIAAARKGNLAAVRLLLEHGADPNLAVRGDGNPIIMAAAEGYGDIIELLLDRGAAIDDVVVGDENALIRASGEGHLAVVKLLVARGADVNARIWDETGWRPANASGDGEWRTPLGMARRGRHDDVVAYLLSVGARE